MIDTQIKYIADGFIRALQSTQEVIEYIDALNNYENDKELASLTERYYSLSADFQKKQYEGTLTQPEIAELRVLVSKIQNNPLNIDMINKQSRAKEILQSCNTDVSNVISMDFAKLAAPVSGCCG